MKSTRSFALLSGLGAAAQAYIIDESCKPWSKQLGDSLTSTFVLANSAKAVFTGLKPDGSGAEWEAQRDLMEYMFAQALTNGKPDPNNVDWRLAQGVYTDVLQYAGQKDPPSDWSTLDNSEVIIYCDFEHYNEGKDCGGNDSADVACEKNVKQEVKMDDNFKNCKSDLATYPGALTFNWAKVGENVPAVVQLCNNYLKTVPADISLGTVKDTASSLAKGLMAFGKWTLQTTGIRTPIDALSTLDALLLHEFTHAIPKNPTADVAGKDSYAWKSCRGFSTTKGTENADSYALFAIGARMISPPGGEQPTRPDENGQIFDLVTKAKRYLLRARKPQQSIALSLASTTMIIEATNRTDFTIPASTGVQTVSAGGHYTIGTDVLSVATTDIVYDSSTIMFPTGWLTVSDASTLQTVTRSSSVASSIPTTSKSSATGSSAGSYSSAISSTGPSSSTSKSTGPSSSRSNPAGSSSSTTSSTSSSSSASKSTGASSSTSKPAGSSSSTIGSTGSSSSTTSATGSSSSGVSSISSSSSTSGAGPTGSSSSTSGVDSTGSASSTSGVGSTGSASSTSGVVSSGSASSTSGAVSTGSSSSTSGVVSTGSSSSVSRVGSTGSSSSAATSTGSSSSAATSTGSSSSTIGSSGSSSSGLGSTGSSSLTSKASTTGAPTATQSNSQTITSSSSSSAAPVTVIMLSKSGTTTPVTYVSTKTSSGDIGPTGAWLCTGPLCDQGSKCIVPLFCKDQPGSGSSWGLCCGWTPPASGGGDGSPQPGGPDPPPEDPKPSNTDQSSNSASKTKTSGQSSRTTSSASQSSASQSSTTSAKSSSSSCSATAMTACDTTTSVYTPSGKSTATTSTITGKCSTTSACSGSLSGSNTATTSHALHIATAIADSVQDAKALQGILSSAKADTTDAELTWSGSGTASSTAGSTTSNSASSASSSQSTSKSPSSTQAPSSSSATSQAPPPSTTTSSGRPEFTGTCANSVPTVTASFSQFIYPTPVPFDLGDAQKAISSYCASAVALKTPAAAAPSSYSYNNYKLYLSTQWSQSGQDGCADPSTIPTDLSADDCNNYFGQAVNDCDTGTTSKKMGTDPYTWNAPNAGCIDFTIFGYTD